MKYIFILLCFTLLTLEAKHIQISQKDIKAWGIKTKKAEFVNEVAFGTYLLSVTTPPYLKQSITLPFEAQTLSLSVALYQEVKKGDLLAKVTGTKWIEVQKQAVADAIELKHHKHTFERKSLLCKEKIIAQKECIAALAELNRDKIKLEASKALLKSYGASDRDIDDLFSNFKIKPTIALFAPIDGVIVKQNASIGESSDPKEALFVLQKRGELWIEGNIEARRVGILSLGEELILRIKKRDYHAKIIQIAPTINSLNQTQLVRMSIKDAFLLLPGLRSDATIKLLHKAYKIPKKSIIKIDGNFMLFIKKGDHFEDLLVDILAQDDKFYYIHPKSGLENPIVISSISVFKNLAGESDE